MQAGLLDNLQWVGIRNDNAGSIPPFGCVRVTGVVIVEAGRVVVSVDQPNTYGCQSNCLINGPVNVGTTSGSQWGTATRSGIITALYDSADGVPAFGDMWGPQNGTWKLKKNTGGFFCLGAPVDTTNHLALFSPAPMLSFRGQPTTTVALGATSPVNVYVGSFGSEFQPTGNPQIASVWNGSGCIVKVSQIATCVWTPDNQGWQFAIFQVST